MTRYEPRMDLDAVSALDVHVHVEACLDDHGHQHLSLDEELMDASAAYFKGAENRTPTVEDLALRLYDRKTQQWRVYFASSKSGTLDQPMVGGFKDGVGSFVGMDEVEGKTVLVRNVWSGVTAKSCRQDWAISTDGGKTWVPTWTSTDTLGG